MAAIGENNLVKVIFICRFDLSVLLRNKMFDSNFLVGKGFSGFIRVIHLYLQINFYFSNLQKVADDITIMVNLITPKQFQRKNISIFFNHFL